MRTLAVALALAAVAAAAADPAIADPVAAGAPVDLASLPELGAAGGSGPVSVHAADADAGRLRNLLAGVAKLDLIELPSGARVTGRFGPGTVKALAALLTSGAIGAPVRPVKRAGKGPDVDLDFVAADRDDLFGILATVLRTSIVVAAPGDQTLDLRVRRVRAGHVVDVASERLGLVATRQGGVVWLRPAGGPALDRKLLAAKGPRKVSLDVKGARAGEIYALLGALGATIGGAACDAGPALTFTVRDVPLGTALAVTAALSGLAPAAGTACAGDAQVAIVQDLQLRAIATIGTARAAAFGAGRGTVVAKRGVLLGGALVEDIGSGHVIFEVPVGGADPQELALQLAPRDTFVDPDVDGDGAPAYSSSGDRLIARAGRILRDGRLAATITGGAEAFALFELPGNEWTTIRGGDLRFVPRDTIVIEPGKVRFRFEDPTSPDGRTGELVLRPRPRTISL